MRVWSVFSSIRNLKGRWGLAPCSEVFPESEQSSRYNLENHSLSESPLLQLFLLCGKLFSQNSAPSQVFNGWFKRNERMRRKRLLPFTSQWTAQDQDESLHCSTMLSNLWALQRLQYCFPIAGGGESLEKKIKITQPNQSENSGLKNKRSISKDADRADENKMLSEPFTIYFWIKFSTSYGFLPLWTTP